eukprot:COSAG01_NODE_258_length_20077_cov_124.162429_10_plen_100_part_00
MLRLHVLSKGLNRQADIIIEGALSSGAGIIVVCGRAVCACVRGVRRVHTGRRTVCRARCPAPAVAALLAHLLRAITKHTSSQKLLGNVSQSRVLIMIMT